MSGDAPPCLYDSKIVAPIEAGVAIVNISLQKCAFYDECQQQDGHTQQRNEDRSHSRNPFSQIFPREGCSPSMFPTAMLCLRSWGTDPVRRIVVNSLRTGAEIGMARIFSTVRLTG
jgi:hypothetical protein